MTIDHNITVNFAIVSNDPDFKAPVYAKPGDAGMDLRIDLFGVDFVEAHGGEGEILTAGGVDPKRAITLPPGRRIVAPLGVTFAIPEGYEGQLRGRSGLARYSGVHVHFATIDSGFRGEVKAIITNHGQEPIVFRHGERVCQIVFAPVAQAQLKRIDAVDWASDTARGTGGFGSSGVS